MAGVEETIGLDLDPALRQVDRLEHELTAVGEKSAAQLGAELDAAVARVNAGHIGEQIIAAGEKSSAALHAELQAAVDGIKPKVDTEGIQRQIGVAVESGKYLVTLTVNNLDGTQKQITRELSHIDIEAALKFDGTPLTAAAREAQRLGRYIEEADRASLVLPKGWREVDGQILMAGQHAQHHGEIIQRTKREYDLTSASAEQLAQHTATVAAEATKAATSAGKLDVEVEKATHSGGRLRETMSSVGGLLAGLGAAVGGAQVAQFFNESVQSASDLNESVSKAKVVFGEGTAAVEKFAGSSATSIGLAKQATLEATATFGNLFTSLGITQKQASDLSPAVVQLAGDLASFNNIRVEDALEKLRSGLIGEAEPLRTVGVALTEAAVQAKAAELGFTKVNGVFTQGELIQARWKLILEQSTNAQGDFARTSSGLANQQRILQAEFANTKAEIGASLMPVFADLVGLARQDLIPMLKEAALNVGPLLAAGVHTGVIAASDLLHILVALTPVIEVIGDVLGAIPPQAIVAVTAFLALSKAIKSVATTQRLLTGGAGLAGALSNLGGAAATTGGAFAAAGPPGLALTGIVAGLSLAVPVLSGVLGHHEHVQTELERAIRSTTDAFADQADSVRNDIRARLEQLIKDEDIQAALRKAKLGIDDIVKAIGQGGKGDITITDALVKALDEGEATRVGTALVKVRAELQSAAQASVDAGVDSGRFTDAQARQAEQTSKTEAGTINYVAALEKLDAAATAATSSQGTLLDKTKSIADLVKDATTAYAAASFGVTDLQAAQVATGTSMQGVIDIFRRGIPTVEEMANIAKFTGVSVETLTKILENSRSDINKWAEAVGQGADQVKKSIDSLSDDTSLEDFLNHLQLDAEKTKGFYDRIANLAARGADDLAQALLEKGPAAARAAAEAAALGDDALAKREKGFEDSKRKNDATISEAERLALQLATTTTSAVQTAVAAAATLPTAAGSAVHDNAQRAAEQAVGGVTDALSQKLPVVTQFAAGAGAEAGKSFVSGLSSTMSGTELDHAIDMAQTAIKFGLDPVAAIAFSFGQGAADNLAAGMKVDPTRITRALAQARTGIENGLSPLASLTNAFGVTIVDQFIAGVGKTMSSDQLRAAVAKAEISIALGMNPVIAFAHAFGVTTGANVAAGFGAGTTSPDSKDNVDRAMRIFGGFITGGIGGVIAAANAAGHSAAEAWNKGFQNGFTAFGKPKTTPPPAPPPPIPAAPIPNDVGAAGQIFGTGVADGIAQSLRHSGRPGTGFDIGGFIVEGLNLGPALDKVLANNQLLRLTDGLEGVVDAAAKIDPTEVTAILEAVKKVDEASKTLAETRKNLGADSIEAKLAEQDLASARSDLNKITLDAIDATSAYDDALKNVTDSIDTLNGSLTALQRLREANKTVADLREEAKKANADLAEFDKRIASATAALADAKAARVASGATAPSIDERRAQATLDDLNRRRGGVAAHAADVNDKMTDAVLASVNAMTSLINLAPDAGAALPAFEGLFRSIGKAAGLSASEIDDLVKKMQQAAYIAIATRNQVLQGTAVAVNLPASSGSTTLSAAGAPTTVEKQIGVNYEPGSIVVYEAASARQTAYEIVQEQKSQATLVAS